MTGISKRLERALESARKWPLDRQEAAAEVLEHIDRLSTTPYALTDEERQDLEQALAEARRGEFASDADVAAMFARHGL